MKKAFEVFCLLPLKKLELPEICKRLLEKERRKIKKMERKQIKGED